MPWRGVAPSRAVPVGQPVCVFAGEPRGFAEGVSVGVSLQSTADTPSLKPQTITRSNLGQGAAVLKFSFRLRQPVDGFPGPMRAYELCLRACPRSRRCTQPCRAALRTHTEPWCAVPASVPATASHSLAPAHRPEASWTPMEPADGSCRRMRTRGMMTPIMTLNWTEFLTPVKTRPINFVVRFEDPVLAAAAV